MSQPAPVGADFGQIISIKLDIRTWQSGCWIRRRRPERKLLFSVVSLALETPILTAFSPLSQRDRQARPPFTMC